MNKTLRPALAVAVVLLCIGPLGDKISRDQDLAHLPNSSGLKSIKQFSGLYNYHLLKTEIVLNYTQSENTEFFVPKVPKSSPCFKDMTTWKLALAKKKKWAVLLKESWGNGWPHESTKSLDSPGNYDQCLAITSDEEVFGGVEANVQRRMRNLNLKLEENERYIKGKYCTIFYRVKKSNPEELVPYREVQSRLGVVSGYRMTSEIFTRSYSTCLPDSCQDSEIELGLQEQFSSSSFELLRIHCQTLEKTNPLTLGKILFLCYIAILLSFMTVAMCLGNIKKNNYSSSGLRTFILAFDPIYNLKQIFELKETRNDHSIYCLHGIRGFSTIAIIFCHQYGINRHSDDPWKFFGSKQNSSLVLCFLIALASFSVDTFFLLSGIVVSYGTFRRMKDSRNFSWFAFYYSRFIRLTPSILVTCWFFSTWMSSLLPGGPWSSEFDVVSTSCQQHFWKEALHVVNYFYADTDPDSLPVCNIQTWSLCVDSQLYATAPLLLLPLLSSFKKGMFLLSTTLSVSLVIPLIVIYVYDLPPSPILGLSFEKNFAYYSMVYVKPWMRCGPWLIGIILGYGLARKKPTMKLNTIVVRFGWVSAFIVQFYLLRKLVNMNARNEDLSPSGSAFLGAAHRPLWASGMAWVIFACQSGYGGIINKVLSHPWLQPLSRLSYSIFLLSLNIQFGVASSRKQLEIISHFNKEQYSCQQGLNYPLPTS